MRRNHLDIYDPAICCSAFDAKKKCRRFTVVEHQGFPLCEKHHKDLRRHKNVMVQDGKHTRILNIRDLSFVEKMQKLTNLIKEKECKIPSEEC